MERQKILEEWGDLYENKLMKAWDYCTNEPFSFAYLKMDKLVPELYKVNKNGFELVDHKSFGVTLPSQLATEMSDDKPKKEKKKKNKKRGRPKKKSVQDIKQNE